MACSVARACEDVAKWDLRFACRRYGRAARGARSIDPGLVLHLLRSGMTPGALAEMLERRSGLLGISGISGDIRELVAAGERPRARLALDVLAWRVRAALGAMTAVLGGVDLIAFTGGIGEHAANVRAEALAGGLGIGALVDAERNATNAEGRIDAAGSTIPVVIVTSREGWHMARAVASDARASGVPFRDAP